MNTFAELRLENDRLWSESNSLTKKSEELKEKIVLEFESICEQLLVQENFSDEESYKFQTKILDKAQEKYLTK